MYEFIIVHFPYSSPVGIATDYGLEGPESNPGGDEIFRPSRPALGPIQSPGQWVSGLFRGRGGRGVRLAPHPHPVCRVPRKSGAIPLYTQRAFVTYKKGEKLPTIFRTTTQLHNIYNIYH